MLDIDHFKQLNDGNDHLTGDDALRRLAAGLLKNTRGIDTVARYGGEEFVVLLPRTTRSNARIVAEKLRRFVERSPFEGEEVLPGQTLTVSIGLASCPEDATEPQDLLERADRALYRAKAGGRNRVCAWQVESRAASN
jgi:diguanylate cyclase (GGDEF)-like protein